VATVPRIKIELIEGRTVDQKRLVAAAITEAVVHSFDVPPEAVTVRFEEVPPHNMAKAGVLKSDG
jgi:4-oxalocrotonate tautomerase